MIQSLVKILEESNTNGIGVIVFGILAYLFFRHLFLYLQNKIDYNLYYSLFALFNSIQLLGILENTFFSSFFYEIQFRGCSLFYAVKSISFILFGLFIMSITDIKNENLKFYKTNLVFIKLTFLVIFILSLIDLFWLSSYNKNLFVYFLFPFFSVVTVFATPIMLKLENSIKYYLISSVLVYNILNAFTYYFITLENLSLENKYMYIFYISILIENVLFTLAIGLRHKELTQEKNKVLLQNLQIKTNPHFIFNSLNTLKFLIVKKDMDNAILYLSKFSKLLRNIINNSIKSSITLEEEITFLKLYIFLENLRFPDEINFSVSINKGIETSNIKIPSLFLQPIIENSIWHGLTTKEGIKSLMISITNIETKRIEIIIEDNGVGRNPFKTQLEDKNSIGIKLTKDRLKTFFNGEGTLKIIDLFDNQNKPCGTKTIIEIPYKTAL